MTGVKNLYPNQGKEILLKSIIQAIPSYVMSVFMLLLPTTLCADIEKMLNSFWWVGQKSDYEKRYMLGIMAENVFEER